MTHLIPRQGTDKKGHAYTRMVKPQKLVIPRATPKLSRGNKKTNENYANSYLGVESLVTQNSDREDFHDVSTSSVIAMLNKIASDSIGRSLSRLELETVIHSNLWEPSSDYDDLEVQSSDDLDFHEIPVWSINRAINEVRLLSN